MSDPFTEIYRAGGWNDLGSGPGSQYCGVKDYCNFLEDFLNFNKIRSVVDFGCGDWNFSKHIHWGEASYLGIDCVKEVIEKNQVFQNEKIKFQWNEFGDNRYPQSDLLILKDVIQHWSNRRVQEFLPTTKQTPFVLWINDWPEGDNCDIEDGGWRYVALNKPPFNEKGAVIFAFREFPKTVFLQLNL
jgi:hypothetical protein